MEYFTKNCVLKSSVLVHADTKKKAEIVRNVNT